MFEERSLFFRCEGEQLLGILALPADPAPTGVLIVVGGPQYRAGSHRQFVHLSRSLAEHGVACLRFDYRGMGDSSGAMRTFEQVDSDIRAAIDTFFASCAPIRSIALWGLCDGASAACFYAPKDSRVSSVVLVNPWVRTEKGLARTHLRHYYVRRLLSPALWEKLFRGQLSLRATATSFLRALSVAVRPGATAASPNLALPERMADALTRFGGKVLIILSGNDYTAKEFTAASRSSVALGRTLRRARTETVEEADHTFSRQAWKQRVAQITAAWVLARH